jgi:hypothetical protein
VSPIIEIRDKRVNPGESFQPFPGEGYSVIYVGIRSEGAIPVLALRDSLGEFTLPIADVPNSIILSED